MAGSGTAAGAWADRRAGGAPSGGAEALADVRRLRLTAPADRPDGKAGTMKEDDWLRG